MPRVKRGKITHRRHREILKAAKGYWGGRSRLFKTANEAVIKAQAYAYRDRRVRKREFRALWIARINAASRGHGLSYSRLADGLSKAGVEVNRKVLSDLAITDAAAFEQLVNVAKAHLQP